MLKLSNLAKKHQKLSGLIIGKKNFFEADKVIHIFSIQEGIVRANVKGARRPGSKLAGSTELFTLGEFDIVKGKNLDILVSAHPTCHFENACGNLDNVSDYFVVSEILQKLMPEEVPNEKIYSETVSLFQALDRGCHKYLTGLYVYKLIILLGYGLDLGKCAKCKKNESSKEGYHINFKEGSIICTQCMRHSNLTAITADELKVLRFIEHSDFGKYSKINMPEQTAKNISHMVFEYLDFIYQNEFKSRRFANALKNL